MRGSSWAGMILRGVAREPGDAPTQTDSEVQGAQQPARVERELRKLGGTSTSKESEGSMREPSTAEVSTGVLSHRLAPEKP